MSNKTIDIEIESLILQGFDPRHQEQISASLRTELERLISEGGVPHEWQDGSPIALAAGSNIAVAANQPPHRIGETVARSIYQGVK